MITEDMWWEKIFFFVMAPVIWLLAGIASLLLYFGEWAHEHKIPYFVLFACLFLIVKPVYATYGEIQQTTNTRLRSNCAIWADVVAGCNLSQVETNADPTYIGGDKDSAYWLFHTFTVFDTSTISGTISNATLHFYVTNVDNSGATIHAATVPTAANPITTGDWGDTYNDEGSLSITSSGWHTISITPANINQSGLTNVQFVSDNEVTNTPQTGSVYNRIAGNSSANKAFISFDYSFTPTPTPTPTPVPTATPTPAPTPSLDYSTGNTTDIQYNWFSFYPSRNSFFGSSYRELVMNIYNASTKNILTVQNCSDTLGCFSASANTQPSGSTGNLTITQVLHSTELTNCPTGASQWDNNLCGSKMWPELTMKFTLEDTLTGALSTVSGVRIASATYSGSLTHSLPPIKECGYIYLGVTTLPDYWCTFKNWIVDLLSINPQYAIDRYNQLASGSATKFPWAYTNALYSVNLTDPPFSSYSAVIPDFHFSGLTAPYILNGTPFPIEIIPAATVSGSNYTWAVTTLTSLRNGLAVFVYCSFALAIGALVMWGIED